MNTKLNQNPNWLELAKQAKWCVKKLAVLCNVSTRTMERHFVKTMGKSPKLWMEDQRQRQAIELLRNGASVKETSGHLGYRHAGNFSRDFKERWGHSPSSLPVSNDVKSGVCRVCA
jgi:transcriptional regulator GlxA family with amidase domain